MVEIFFGIITRQAIRRGTFTSVPDLIGAIRTFTDGWNDRCQPFAWTKTADQILPHATGVKEHQSHDTSEPVPRLDKLVLSPLIRLEGQGQSVRCHPRSVRSQREIRH
jgi:hypothetical protein